MDVVRTDVQSLRAEYRATLLEATEARERIDFLTRQLERQELLKEKGMSRADVYDEARHNLEVARTPAGRTSTRAPTACCASLVGDPQLPAERHPRYVEAKAAYDAAAVDLARTQVKAPTAGVVSNMKLQVGEHVEKGAPIFSLIRSGAGLDRGQLQGDAAHPHARRPAGAAWLPMPIRTSSGRRSGRGDRAGDRRRVRRAAAAERDRQLGEGGAAHSGAHPGRAAAPDSRSCAPA